jgi:hypothetical protein
MKKLSAKKTFSSYFTRSNRKNLALYGRTSECSLSRSEMDTTITHHHNYRAFRHMDLGRGRSYHICLRNWNLGVGISGKSGSLAPCCIREEMVHKVTRSEEIGWLWGLCYIHLSLCFGTCVWNSSPFCIEFQQIMMHCLMGIWMSTKHLCGRCYTKLCERKENV